jgi:hypothetical protein
MASWESARVRLLCFAGGCQPGVITGAVKSKRRAAFAQGADLLRHGYCIGV